MKKMRGFYILFASSVLASLIRLYSTFLAKPTQLTVQNAGGMMPEEVIKDIQTISDLQYSFQTAFANRILIALTLVLLVVTLFFLIKKSKSAMMSYLAYLAAMLLYNINSYLFANRLASQFQSSVFNSKFTLYSFIFNLVVTGLYTWVTLSSFGEKK